MALIVRTQIPGMTSEYRSSVMPILLCPRRSLAILG